MATHPYIPLYVDDYDAHTAHLTPAQDGIYGRLLRLCWRTPGCSLPNDEAWIARKVRLSAADWARIGKPVLEEFFKLHRGRLVQKRLKAEYDEITRKKSARKAAGKAGGDAKARKTKENPSSNASVLLGDTRAFPNPEPKPEEETPNPPEGGRTVLTEFFAKAWKAYPEAGRGNHGPDAAWPEWDKASGRAGGEARLLVAVERRAAWLAEHPRERVKAFHRWLRDDGFVSYLSAEAPVVQRRWSGPPDVWDLVATAETPSFANTWLADCRWSDIPRAIIGGTTSIKRLREKVGPALADGGIELQERAA